MRLSDITKITRPLSIDFDNNQKFNFSYFPNMYTPAHEDQALRAQSEATAGAYLKKLLIPVLASWDVEDEFDEVEFRRLEKAVPLDDAAATIQDATGKTLLELGSESRLCDVLAWDKRAGKLVEAWSMDHTMKKTGKKVMAPIPISDLGLHRMPLPIIMEMMEKINEDMRPGKPRIQTSESSSF